MQTATLSHKESQCEQVLQHLVRLGSIMPHEARDLYGCDRLGARIDDLKKEGYEFEPRELVKVGHRKWVARYRLKKNQSILPL